MKSSNILSKLESFVAPVSLSDEFCKKHGAYDNSGIIVDVGSDVSGAVFSLDFSKGAVDRAMETGYNLIVTHHPAIYGGISRINTLSDPLSSALARCIKNGISVISMHLNFDCAPRGIDYFLMKGLGGESPEDTMIELSSGGYGRVYEIDEQTAQNFIQGVRGQFCSDKIRFYKCRESLKKVASFCGAGADEQSVDFAIKSGAEVFVSSDMKHHLICALIDAGISVVDMPHYTSEVYGFKRIYGEVESKLGIPSEFYADKLLI